MELIKGTLDVLVLKTVSWGPLHGYAISRWIRDRTDERFQVQQGALYPALRRLEARGFLTSEWAVSDSGRDTKVYTITSDGRAELARAVGEWSRYVDTMSTILHAEGPA